MPSMATRDEKIEEYVARAALERILDVITNEVSACCDVLSAEVPEADPTLISCELASELDFDLWPDTLDAPKEALERPEERDANARAHALAGRVLFALMESESQDELQDIARAMVTPETTVA